MRRFLQILSITPVVIVSDDDLRNMPIFRLLSHLKTEEEVKELNDLVCQYYARKIDEEMDRLWDDGKWSQEKIDETLKEHLRTPYNA